MIKRLMLSVGAPLSFACLVLAGTVPAQASTSAAWRVFDRYARANHQVDLVSVSAASTKEIWAAGDAVNLKSGAPATLVLHWRGHSWATVALPKTVRANIGSSAVDVQESSASNVWISNSKGWARWNGHTWRSGRLPAAHPGKIAQSGQLLVFGPTDVWNLGTYGAGGTTTSFAQRYNGRKWQSMPAPGVTDFQAAASSPSDICVVNGNFGSGNGTTTVLKCWNGHRWRKLPLPASLDQQNAIVASIRVNSPDNIWLGGGAPKSSGIVGLAAHWNGNAWHVTDLPAVKTLSTDVLYMLVPDGRGGMWASGTCECGPAWRLWHYTGGKWKGPTEPVSGNPNFFFRMALIPRTTTTLAVGFSGDAGMIWRNGRP